MGRDTYERSARGPDRRAEAAAQLTVREAMEKRDIDLRAAMGTLRAAVDRIASGVARLVQATEPDAPAQARQKVVGERRAADRSHEAPTLAGEIHAVAYRLRLLESALERAARKARRRAAAERPDAP